MKTNLVTLNESSLANERKCIKDNECWRTKQQNADNNNTTVIKINEEPKIWKWETMSDVNTKKAMEVEEEENLRKVPNIDEEGAWRW